MERNIEQAERGLIKLLSEELKNVVHSIEAELASLLHAYFPADSVTEENHLGKAAEKINQMLENRNGKNSREQLKTIEYSNRLKFVNFTEKEKRTRMASTNNSQPELNQEAEAAVVLEPKNNGYNLPQNSTESMLPKRISCKDANCSSDALLANHSANLEIVLNETANQHQEDMKKHSTDEENNIENNRGNQFGEMIVDSGKYCSVISLANVLGVS